jgi:hypothetical protein
MTGWVLVAAGYAAGAVVWGVLVALVLRGHRR